MVPTENASVLLSVFFKRQTACALLVLKCEDWSCRVSRLAPRLARRSDKDN